MEPLNDLTILLALFPKKPWYRGGLSRNSNISLKFYDLLVTSLSPTENNKWNEADLLANPNISIDVAKRIIKNNPRAISQSSFPNYSESLSANPNFTWKIIKNNPEIKWNYKGVSKNPNITWDIIRTNPEFHYRRELFANPNLTEVSFGNPTPTFGPTLTGPFNDYLMVSKRLDWGKVRDHLPEISNRIHVMMLNKKLPINVIFDNPQILNIMPGFLTHLSRNPNVTWDIVQAHPEILWNYAKLVKNPGITLENIISNPVLRDKYKRLSSNPNLNWKTVYQNPEIKWNYYFLSSNTFGYRSYSWSEFLGDPMVGDTVKEKVLAFHYHDKNPTMIKLILAIYDSKNINTIPLVHHYFTQNYSNLEFDLELDLSLSLKEIMSNLEEYLKVEIGNEMVASEEYSIAKERFGQF